MQLTGLIVPVEKEDCIGLPIRQKASQQKAAAKFHYHANPECKRTASMRCYRAELEVEKAMFKRFYS